MEINIKPNGKLAYQLFHNGILALARAEKQGIRIDTEYCEKQHKKLTRKIEWSENQFKDTTFYRDWKSSIKKEPNLYSPQQLGNFLYKVKHIKPTSTTKTGQGTTDEEALSQLDMPELQMLLTAKKLKKIRDVYLAGFMNEQVDGFIHPSFNLHLVRTFRSSSNNPNFQNIPKRDKEARMITRSALYPRKGHQLMEVDFSGIEVRIAACYHKDPTMLKYIHDPTTDMHRDMAQQIFVLKKYDKENPGHKLLRTATKNGFVFPQFYGDYYGNNAKSLAQWGKLPETGWRINMGADIGDGKLLGAHMIQSGISSFDAFVEFLRVIEDDFWGRRFPVYKRWKEKWWRAYTKKGYFHTLTGFTCSGEMGKNDAINYPVQGSAFHCLLWTLTKLDEYIIKEGLTTRIIGQIHDSIVLDIYPPERTEIVNKVKEIVGVLLPRAWDWIVVPLDIEFEMAGVDESMAQMEEVKFSEIC